MKKLILTGSFIAAASIASFAQNVQSATPPASTAAQARTVSQSPAPEAIATKNAKMYQKQLGLTEQQYKGVYEAELSYAKQDQMSRANGGPGPGPGQSMQMGMGRDQRIRNVLSADQYAKYESLKPKTATPAGH